MPTGDENRNVVCRLCRGSKEESPRSRCRSPMYCTSVPPDPVKLDASSIDFENVYKAVAEMPRVKRRVIRVCAALKIEFAPDVRYVNPVEFAICRVGAAIEEPGTARFGCSLIARYVPFVPMYSVSMTRPCGSVF